MGPVWVLAWPEVWSPLQGCAHPGSSPAAVVDLERVSRCNPGQSRTTGPRVTQVSPSPGGRVAGATGEVAPALPSPEGGSAPARPAKILVAVGCMATGAAAIPVSRAPGLQSLAQGVAPTASFLPRQDQRLELTWTAFY